MITLRRSVVVIALGLGVLLSATPAATAQGGEAYLRLAHLSPDTPDVDVYVGSVADPARSFVVPGVGYGAVSAYRSLPAGPYVVSMRVAGAAASSPAVIATSVNARPGGAYTIAGVGRTAELGLAVLTDRLDIPAAGRASVRVINGAVNAPTVDVGPEGGPAWASGVRFGTDTAYMEVPLGTWKLAVTAPGRPAVTLPTRLDANSAYTVLLVDRGGGLVAELIRDSAGTAVVPVGGVDTGFGGAVLDPGALIGGALAASLAGALLAARVGAGRGRER